MNRAVADSGGTENREMYVYKSVAESGITDTAFRVISLVAQDCAVAEGGTPPVSPCKPLCAIFLEKPSVYSLSAVKANIGRLRRRC